MADQIELRVGVLGKEYLVTYKHERYVGEEGEVHTMIYKDHIVKGNTFDVAANKIIDVIRGTVGEA